MMAALKCTDSADGWTSIRHDAVNSGNKATSWLYYKIAGANEPASYGWNISSNWAAGVMGAWRGASTSPIDNASGATASGTSPISASAPSLTPRNNNELQIYFYGSQANAAPTITLSNALTQRFNARSRRKALPSPSLILLLHSPTVASPTYPATAISLEAVMTAQAISSYQPARRHPHPPVLRKRKESVTAVPGLYSIR